MRIFLGFDAVLRPASAPRGELQPECVVAPEAVVLRHEDLKGVISSAWRLAQGLDELRGLFSAHFAARSVGATPDPAAEQEYPRHAEILAYLARRELAGTPWIAIDSTSDQYPSNAPLLLVDGEAGFDEECARRLEAWAARAARQEAAAAPDLDFSKQP